MNTDDSLPPTTRRSLITGGLATGMTTLVLPSVAAAASVGGAGSEPIYLNATTFTADPNAYGHPVGGIWASGGSNWRFTINPTKWAFPLDDAGKTDPTLFTYEYQISPNNGATWHTMSMVPRDILQPNQGTKLFGAWVSYSIIPETYYGAAVPTNGLTWTRTVEGADGQWDWVINAYVRVIDNGTVIDMSPAFWLW